MHVGACTSIAAAGDASAATSASARARERLRTRLRSRDDIAARPSRRQPGARTQGEVGRAVSHDPSKDGDAADHRRSAAIARSIVRRVLRRVLVVLVSLSVTTQTAAAAEVSYDGAGMSVTGAPGESSRLTVRFDPNVRMTVHDDAGGLRPGFGCLGTTRDVTCGLLGPQCHPCSARIDLGDGNDALELSGTSQRGPF